MSHKFCNTLCNTIEKRLTMLFQPFTLDFQSSILLERCFGALKELRGSDVIKVLRYRCNGWATSQRYHEDKLLPCVFGCEGAPASLPHYLCCIRFWSGIGLALNKGETLIHVDPLIKCCLDQPTVAWAKLIAVASRCYHAIKFDHAPLVERAVATQDFDKCRAVLSEMAVHFGSELGVT